MYFDGCFGGGFCSSELNSTALAVSTVFLLPLFNFFEFSCNNLAPWFSAVFLKVSNITPSGAKSKSRAKAAKEGVAHETRKSFFCSSLDFGRKIGRLRT